MPNRLEQVLRQARKLVVPTRAEEKEVRAIANEVEHRVRMAADGAPERGAVVLGGSYAKGTWLRGGADIDLFVKFPQHTPREQLEAVGLNIGFEALKDASPGLRYSEHPYVEATMRGIKVNVVACYDVPKGQWKSAADRSPYHTLFVKSAFDAKMKDEARLLKKFVKGIGLYGAEIEVQGFSGYVCEVLIAKYRTFTHTLKAASTWSEKEAIAIEAIDPNLLKIFKGTPIVLDPVDPRRNLAQAIAPANMAYFILASRAFLKEPIIDYFQANHAPAPKTWKPPLVDNLVLLPFRHSQRSVDVLWGQLRKTLRFLGKQLSIAGYRVLREACASNEKDESAFLFLLEDRTLPPAFERIGPRVFSSTDSQRFVSKNSKSALLMWAASDHRIHALLRFKQQRAEDWLKWTLSKVSSTSGVSRGLVQELRESHQVYTGRRALPTLEKNPWLASVTARLLSTDRFAFRGN